MNVPYRVGVTHGIVLAFFAGALAACGVKGDLERPPAASYAEPAAAKGEQPRTSAGAASSKVFTEESRVQRVPAYSILPKMPPEEWEKGKDAKAKQTPKKSGEPDGPDRPFILDGLL